MPLVVERQVAIAEMAVRGKIEQQQPPDARHEHESRIAHPRRNRLRSRLEPSSQPRRRRQHDGGGCAQPQHERRGRREPPGSFAPEFESRPAASATAPCPPMPSPPKPRAPPPRRSRAKWSDGIAAAARIRRASRPPIASPRNAADPAWRRSWRRSRARAGRPPSARRPARAHRARERRRIAPCRERTAPAAARCRPRRPWRDAHPPPRRATEGFARPCPDTGSAPRSRLARARTRRPRTRNRAAADRSPRAHRGRTAPCKAGARLRSPRSHCPASADRRGPRVVAGEARTVLPALRAAAREMHFARAHAHRPTVAAAGRPRQPRIRHRGDDRVARAPAARQGRRMPRKARAGPGPASPDRNRCAGVAPLAAGIVGGKPIEPWQKRTDAAEHQRRLHDKRPRHRSAARWACACARVQCSAPLGVPDLEQVPGPCSRRFCAGRSDGATRRADAGTHRNGRLQFRRVGRLGAGSLGAAGDDCPRRTTPPEQSPRDL